MIYQSLSLFNLPEERFRRLKLKLSWNKPINVILDFEKTDGTKNFWVKHYALEVKLTAEDLAKINEALSAIRIQGDRYSKALTALANR